MSDVLVAVRNSSDSFDKAENTPLNNMATLESDQITTLFGGTNVDCSEAVSEYISKEDWRINANANTGYSNAGLINNVAGKIIANFWLDEVYSAEEGRARVPGLLPVP